MTINRVNGKVTTTTRALKRERRHARKSHARQTSEPHLASLRIQAFNYNAKQSRRWLSARLLSENRGFLTKEAAAKLEKHFKKTEHQLQNPLVTETVLAADAQRVLSQLELEREAARAEQGFPERVRDWWAAPTMPGKKKRKGKWMGKKKGATAVGSVPVEGLREDVEGLVLGEEEEEEEMEMLEGGEVEGLREDVEGLMLEEEEEEMEVLGGGEM